MMQFHYSRRPCNHNVRQPHFKYNTIIRLRKCTYIEAITAPKFQKGWQLMAASKMDGTRTVWDISSFCTRFESSMLPNPFRICTANVIITMSKFQIIAHSKTRMKAPKLEQQRFIMVSIKSTNLGLVSPIFLCHSIICNKDSCFVYTYKESPMREATPTLCWCE